MDHNRISRNDPCPCGSGKKFKRCCLPKEQAASRPPRAPTITDIRGRQRDGPQFPMGTLALYGPDNVCTTKIAAAVKINENAEMILRRWVATDVTTNPKVHQEIQDFFKEYGVKSVAASSGNMGCPHEEGEDFPVGEDCPFCPFWAGKQGSNARDV